MSAERAHLEALALAGYPEEACGVVLARGPARAVLAGLGIELLASGCAPAAGVVPRRTLLGVGS